MEQEASGWRLVDLEGEPERVTMRLLESNASTAAAACGGGVHTPATSEWSIGLEWNIPAMENMFYPTLEDDIQHLLQGPQDERDLDKWLAGESSLSLKDVMTVQTPPNPMLNLLDVAHGVLARDLHSHRYHNALKPLDVEDILKDKWRNLLKACGIKFTSKRKEKLQKSMMVPLDLSLIEQIKHVARKHPYPRRKNY
uniref:Uncharacterized protein n=1 Tax=Leersia perrieri TaxID=77586 RepID=A0A0D9XK48_9ORYZ